MNMSMYDPGFPDPLEYDPCRMMNRTSSLSGTDRILETTSSGSIIFPRSRDISPWTRTDNIHSNLWIHIIPCGLVERLGENEERIGVEISRFWINRISGKNQDWPKKFGGLGRIRSANMNKIIYYTN